MKHALLVLCLFCGTAAFGQVATYINSDAHPTTFFSHESRATQFDMATEQNILSSSSPAHATGVRPLWEVAPPLHEVSLGDAARAARKEHANMKKSAKVWEN